MYIRHDQQGSYFRYSAHFAYSVYVLFVYLHQGSCGSLKAFDFFSRFSTLGKSLKTDMVLENL